MGTSNESQVVGADLVGNIPIGRHTVTAHHHHVHLTTTHQQSACTIHNHGARHPETAQLPGR